MDAVIDLLERHLTRYSGMELADAAKLLYQHFMGPEHLVSDEASVLPRLEAELAACPPVPCPPGTAGIPIGNGLCRLELGACRALGVSAGTVARLFRLTSQSVRPDRDGLDRALEALRALPFPPEETERFLTEYRAAGLPALHHSPRFRAAFRPAYRVIADRFLPLLPALGALDAALTEKERLIAALDGPCASGKTTAGEALAEVYRCPLLHMDDFFLRPEQRTPERLAQPGGNVDYERFDAEVLTPLAAGRPAVFRPWDCGEGRFAAVHTVRPAPLVLVEGSYSLHPALRDRYGLAIWVRADPETRRARLLRRGGPEGLERFESRWIPLEDRYFAACRVREACQVHLDLS